MKYWTYLLVLSANMVWAGKTETQKGTMLNWSVISSAPDSQLSKNEAKIEFQFKKDYSTLVQETVLFASNNSGNKGAKPNQNGIYSYKTKPGKYVFQFFLSNQYFEITTDSILIKPAHKIVLAIWFESSVNPIICDKPVIYLYPEKTTPVHVELNLLGDFLFTYPAYNKGWDFIADSTGNLHFDNKTYNYLFWEGTTTIDHSKVNAQTGFCIPKENLTSFFEEKLTLAGLNTKEMADFITYWVPRMQGYAFHKIQFLFTDDFNQYAPLTISPKPDHVNRIFMLWTPLENNLKQALNPQEIPAFDRTGFNILEWGGTQCTNTSFNLN